MTVHAANEVLPATVGAFVLLPRNVPHTFAVESGSARLLVIMAPAGSLGMYSEAERQFGERAMPARPQREDLAVVAEPMSRYGVTIVGPHPRDRYHGERSTRRPGDRAGEAPRLPR